MQEIYTQAYGMACKDQKIVSVKSVKSKQNEVDKLEPIVVKLHETWETLSVELQDGRHVRKMLSNAKGLKDSE
jgi:hypothetical protein